MEPSVCGDKLISHGEKSNYRLYTEERVFNKRDAQASFYFITRVYDDYVKKVIKKITSGQKPDVLVINSFLWDITRFGDSKFI